MDLSASELPDYSDLIDEEIWAFIHQTQQCYPDDTTSRSIEEQRAIYTAMCCTFSHGYPKGVTAADHVIAGHDYDVPIRRYEPESVNGETVIAYMHGGGFVVGGLDSHDDVCAELCARTGFKVTSIDYRLSPENTHPAAFNDCLACVEHEALKNQAPMLLCGDSAGGNLAAAVAHSVSASNNSKNAVKLVGQVLIYPELGGDSTKGSYVQHANAPMLTAEEVSFYRQVRVAGALAQSDPSFAPLQAGSFSKLPNTVVISAQCDPLSDDGRDYCDAIVKAGGHARWINECGLVHGFLRARRSSTRANASFDTIVEMLKELGS